MIIRLLKIVVFLGFCLTIQAQGLNNQVLDPVKWEGSVDKVSDSVYQLRFNASIEPEWHLYSQFTDENGGLPLTLEFLNEQEGFFLDGTADESETFTEYSDIFEVDETFFKERAQLVQKIKITDPQTAVIKTILDYQVCRDVCIKQVFYFAFDLKNKTAQVFSDYDAFQEYGTTAQLKKNEGKKAEVSREQSIPIDQAAPKEQALWTIFILAFLSGFLALLTPCVFPMIPMTVGYFTKRSTDTAKGKRNAILYGVFIIVIYVVLGTVITAIFGADALNALATNVWFNIIFFLLLLVFAISFFGAFEIMLPNSWANAVDKQADRGGFVGIFFMALALAIVSFSCTGPIVGTLLVQAAAEGGIAPIVGMFGFSLAIAIPFALFALFPGWMNSLPKSGGWLNSVKVVLGFLELALAFKFLSNADLVLQAHWLEREVFLSIWITIFAAMTLYLFGKIRLSHDSGSTGISSGRLILGLATLAFTVYLVPGLWGAPLQLISGITPPLQYSEAPYGVGYLGGDEGLAEGESLDNTELGPYQIVTFTDYGSGIAFAKAKNKPVLLDFTGRACANCRKMEERVWGEPQILGKLKNDIVLISLYADEATKLPETEQYTSETTGNRVRTIGNKWSDFQIKNYGVNAQPYYVLIDTEGNMLNEPVGYTPDVAAYNAWLEEGLGNFKK